MKRYLRGAEPVGKPRGTGGETRARTRGGQTGSRAGESCGRSLDSGHDRRARPQAVEHRLRYAVVLGALAIAAVAVAGFALHWW